MLMVVMWLSATLLLVGPAQAADPQSLLELLRHVPDLPATVQEAGTWYESAATPGSQYPTLTLIQPKLIAVRAEIEASKQASEAIFQSAGEALSGEPQQGRVVHGIDMTRMQKDSAYQKEMQKKIKTMPMQEQMALMNEMMAPQMEARQQDMMAGTEESPAVEAAVEASRTFQIEGSQWHLGRSGPLQEELNVDQAVGKRPIPAGMPKRVWDDVGCDSVCDKQWTAYAEKAWPISLAHETKRLQARRAVLQRYKSELVERLQDDKLVVATQFGKGARSQMNRQAIVMHYGGMLGYIKDYADMVERATKESAEMFHRGARLNALGLGHSLMVITR